MGMSASGDEFVQRSDQALAGLQGFRKLVDDILLVADNEEQFLKRFLEMVQRCFKAGITLSRKEIQIGFPELRGRIVGFAEDSTRRYEVDIGGRVFIRNRKFLRRRIEDVDDPAGEGPCSSSDELEVDKTVEEFVPRRSARIADGR